jgi:hypothetical protein
VTKHLLALTALLALQGCVPPKEESKPARMETASAVNPLGTIPQLSFSAERYCHATLPLTHVTVAPREATVSESNEHSISSLTFSHPAYHKDQVILGSTETAFQMDMTADLASVQVPTGGEFCSRLGVKVVVFMRFHVVNVARELKPGTCAYNKVREHEYRHVYVNRQALYHAAEVLQQEMRAFFRQTVFYGNPADLREELKGAIESHWMPRLQQLKEAGLAEHQAIDSADEYASNNTDCEGEIPALLKADGRFDAMLVPAPAPVE